MTELNKIPTLSVIIPVYNEEKTINKILNLVSEIDIVSEVVIVDDCSKDGSIEKINSGIESLSKQKPHIKFQFSKNDRNRGKGATIRHGFSLASCEVIVIQDADLEYDPKDYKKLLEPVLLFDADLVLGSRLSASQLTRVYYFWHKLGNKFITLLFNIMNNTTFTDIYSCYVIFKADLINPNNLLTSGWEQHAEILSTVVSKSSSFYEVPVNYYGRTYEEGKKIRPHNAIPVLLTIVLERVFR